MNEMNELREYFTWAHNRTIGKITIGAIITGFGLYGMFKGFYNLGAYNEAAFVSGELDKMGLLQTVVNAYQNLDKKRADLTTKP